MQRVRSAGISFWEGVSGGPPWSAERMRGVRLPLRVQEPEPPRSAPTEEILRVARLKTGLRIAPGPGTSWNILRRGVFHFRVGRRT